MENKSGRFIPSIINLCRKQFQEYHLIQSKICNYKLILAIIISAHIKYRQIETHLVWMLEAFVL